ncbi:hypothetical protein V5799_029840 [Amblyomma americanum]|uniref:Uncharacterized protein n=1 Tax=Amblyomma americanum TaxID=6943 RepID=A0AAQ4EPV5_AMBAM
MSEEEDEMADDLTEKVVNDLFGNTLVVTTSSDERIHGIGRKQLNKQRPVIIKLTDHREKMAVLNCRNLKREDVLVSDDFSAPTKLKRQKLWQSTSEFRKKNGGKAKLVYAKIKIDGELFARDDMEIKWVPVRKSADSLEL